MLKSFTKLFSVTFCYLCLALLFNGICVAAEEKSVSERTYILEQQLDSIIAFTTPFESGSFNQNVENTSHELKSLGYLSSALYSSRLIDKLSFAEVSDSQRLVILKAARTLSPNHPEILLRLSTYVKDFGLSQSFNHLYTGLISLPNHPILLSSMLVKISLLLVFTLSIALLIAVFGNLVFSSSEVLSFIASKFKKDSRIFTSSLLMILVYLLPLVLPLFFLLIVWSILVAFGSSRMRFAPLVSSVLVLTFVSILPGGLKTVSFSDSVVGRSIDSIQTKDFDPNSASVLKKSEPLFNSSPVFPILLSRNQHIIGDVQSALDGYKASLVKGISDKGLFYLVQSNIAQIQFNRGEQELAFESWKKLYEDGWREYELLFNLSVSSVATYKKQEYEKYFGEFRKEFRSEEINFSRNIKPIIAGIPNSSIYSFTFKKIRSLNIPAIIKTENIEKTIFGSDPTLLKYFSVLTLFWGILLASKNQARYRYRVSIVADRSQLKLDQFSFIRYFPLLNLFLKRKEWVFFVGMSLLLFVSFTLFNLGKLLGATSGSLGPLFLQVFAVSYLVLFGLRIYNLRGANVRL